MKVAKDWLKDLVEVKSMEEVEKLLPLKTISTKEITPEFIELDMKGYNRADLLSMRGVAYEVAAITDSQVKFEETAESEFVWIDKNLPSTPISITDENLSPVQAVAKIEGLNFSKSPEAWVKKLTDSGMRSVNNIADVTNLVMLEYGHPLHSFDAETIKDDTINIRLAKEGEELLTLDGKLRKLTSEDIVLADEKRALDVAGIMGSKDTEIKESTTTILLSASIFNPSMVRKTSQRLGLTSEASKRFYHGLTKKRLFQALDAAIRMYQDLGGKLTALNIVGDTQDQLKKVPLTQEKINSLMGVELVPKQTEEYLTKLNFQLKPEGSKLVVTPPYWRLVIDIDEDLIEEVARMYGYEKIPSTPLPNNPPAPIDQKLFDLIYNLKKALADQGLTEVQTYSFYSTKVLNALGFDDTKKKQLIKVTNPISSETEYLKETNWPNLVEVIEKNSKQGFQDMAIFEVGKIYYHNQAGIVDEKFSLSVAIMNDTDNPIQELYQLFNQLNTQLNLKIKADIEYKPKTKLELFHPNRFIQFFTEKGVALGGIAEVHKRVTDKMGLSKRVAIMEIGIPKLL